MVTNDLRDDLHSVLQDACKRNDITIKLEIINGRMRIGYMKLLQSNIDVEQIHNGLNEMKLRVELDQAAGLLIFWATDLDYFSRMIFNSLLLQFRRILDCLDDATIIAELDQIILIRTRTDDRNLLQKLLLAKVQIQLSKLRFNTEPSVVLSSRHNDDSMLELLKRLNINSTNDGNTVKQRRIIFTDDNDNDLNSNNDVIIRVPKLVDADTVSTHTNSPAEFALGLLNHLNDAIVDREKTDSVDEDSISLANLLIGILESFKSGQLSLATHVLRTRGNTGVYLQYTHARLCGIKRQSPNSHNDSQTASNTNSNKDSLITAQVCTKLYNWYHHLQTVVSSSSSNNTAPVSHLSRLLGPTFQLLHSISTAYRQLRVKNINSPQLASDRMLLFQCSRVAVELCIRMFGLNPITEM